MFLASAEIARLTGRKLKRLQIEQLRKMGIPFWINASGHAIVARSAIEGSGKVAENLQTKTWTPRPLRHAA